MTYNQYTTCTPPKSHVQMNQYIQATIQAILAAGIAALIVFAAGMPWCLLFAALIGADMWLLGYCHWWLEDRLVCLGGDRSAAGMLVAIEPPDEKTGFDAIDTDYSINLLPFPNQPADSQAKVAASVPYGVLVAEQPSTHDVGLPFTGEQATDKATGVKSEILHAEFEGAGVRDTLIGAQIALGLSTAALIACLAIPPPWGLIVAGILALLALLAMLFGLLFGLGDTGSPSDVNPSLGDLHTNNDSNKGKGSGADILYVLGAWVYDSGHNNESPSRGWNEIHPIKYCQKIDTWDGDWPIDLGVKIKRQDDLVAEANTPQTVGSQKQPQNHWDVHPVIDGCQPADEPPIIK